VAADAQEMRKAYATIVSQHQKMFLQTAFGINPNGTPITNPSLCPDKLKKYNSVKSVEKYNEMINIITKWGDGLFSGSVLLGTLYLSAIGGSTWIITLQLCKQKTLYFNLL
jgi:hypothetical protein